MSALEDAESTLSAGNRRGVGIIVSDTPQQVLIQSNEIFSAEELDAASGIPE